MKKWFCTIIVSLMTCFPALADIPVEPRPTKVPNTPGGKCILMRYPILIVAIILVIASIVLWMAIRAHKAK